MSRRWIPTALACVLLTNTVTSSALGEVLRGQSSTLGIQFEAVGGATWCRPDVTVRLTAGNASTLDSEVPEFARMIGRIRAVVTAQCPATERILFDASAGKLAVLAIEITRLTKWRRLFKVDLRTRKPICTPQSTECALRADAYFITHSIMRGERYAEAELTTIMDERDEAHAVWVWGEVVGKLTIQDSSALLSRYSSISRLADAVMSGTVHQCAGEGAIQEQPWSETWPEGPNLEVAVRGVSCRPKDGLPNHHTLLVALVGQQLQFFAFWARSEDREATRVAVKQVAMAIGRFR